MTTQTSRVALVTGASRGIGAVIARQLASEGFAVAINYARSASDASRLVVELRQSGSSSHSRSGRTWPVPMTCAGCSMR